MDESENRQLHLLVQASIPVADKASGEAEYDNLKIFLQSISKDVTLTGRLIEMLEPCCTGRKEQTSHGHDSKIP